MRASQMNDTISRFADAFNDNNLDLVMTFFTDDAVYEPGDGAVHKGKAEIRAALEPQFGGAFGVMRFDERDRIIDAENGKAAFRWICRHDISSARPRGLARRIEKFMACLLLGKTFGWQGLDVFHFDADCRIRGKFSYGWYRRRPLLDRALG